jgi:hypothetical protein
MAVLLSRRHLLQVQVQAQLLLLLLLLEVLPALLPF